MIGHLIYRNSMTTLTIKTACLQLSSLILIWSSIWLKRISLGLCPFSKNKDSLEKEWVWRKYFIFYTGISFSWPRMATFTASLWVLFTAYCQWWSRCKGSESSYHSFIHSGIFGTFWFIRTKRKRIFEKYSS